MCCFGSEKDMNGKEACLRKELFEKKTVVQQYSVISIEAIQCSTQKAIARKFYNLFNDSSLSMFLYRLTTNPLYDRHLQGRRRHGESFLYLESPEMFGRQKVIAEWERFVIDRMDQIIKSNAELARCYVFRDNELLFARAFVVAGTMMAFNDIDVFRIGESRLGNVLGIEHGKKVPSKEINVGVFENNILYTFYLPIIFGDIYVADLKVDCYKACK